MHSISGSSMLGKYDRLLVVMTKPARRNRSMVAFSRLPFGMPSFSIYALPPFIPCFPLCLASIDGIGVVSARLGDLPAAIFQAPEEAAFVAFVAHPGAQR